MERTKIEVVELSADDVLASKDAMEYLRRKADRVKQTILGFHASAQRDAKSSSPEKFFLNLRVLATLSEENGPSKEAFTAAAYWRETCTLMVLKGLAFETALDQIMEEEIRRTEKSDLSWLNELFAAAKLLCEEEVSSSSKH